MRKFIAALLVASIAAGAAPAWSGENDDLALAVSLSADGGRYDIAKLVGTKEALVAAGVSPQTASTIVKRYVNAGLAPDDISSFAAAAIFIAAATDRPAASVARDLAKAFTGGVEEVRALDAKLNFLTADQLETMRSMQAAGDRANAVKVGKVALMTKLAAKSN